MTIDEAIARIREHIAIHKTKEPRVVFISKALNMAIHALEMQKKLAEFSGMDICNLVEDYDYDDESNISDISEYEYEADVDDFLIDEIDEETEEGE